MKTGLIVGIIIFVLVVVGAFIYLGQPTTNTQSPNTGIVNTTNDNPGTVENNPAPETNNTTTQPQTPPASTFRTLPIEIKGFAFSPSTIEINVGDVIIWTNKDSSKHTVTSDSGDELDSSLLSNGHSYSHTFTQAGTFSYHCSPHPSMKGKVIVK